MGAEDKVKHAAQEVEGGLKEAVGKATHDEQLEADGRAEKAKANLKQAADDVKDALK